MQAIHKLVGGLFVKELRYRRLDLPKGLTHGLRLFRNQKC